MGINEECDVLQSMLSQVLDSLAEVQTRAKYLPDCDIYELQREISDILEICCEEMSRMKLTQNQIELIQEMIGVPSFLPSISSPTNKLANTTVNDTSIQDAIAKSEIFLTTAIASGVPTWLALELANLPGDSWMLYENPNATERLTDLTQNPASDYYQKKPSTQLQGDQGELVLLKMLLDSDDTENLLSSLQIKPKLNFENGKDYCKPDFYLISHRLICDAKAYKPSSINGIKTAAKKYVNYLQENGGGEVKFYVPRDTYAKCQHQINRLQSQENGVNVTIHPMTIDYEHILWKKELIYTYLKSLLKFKVTPSMSNNSSGNIPGGVDVNNLSQINSQQRTHILDSDTTGGGHGPGRGISGKSEFPARWSDEQIMNYISEVIQDPNSIWFQQNGKAGAKYTKRGNPVTWQIDGTRDGVNIRVIVEPDGKGVITAFPTNISPNP